MGKSATRFPEMHRAELEHLLDRHVDVFDDSGPLRQTPFIKHVPVLTDPKPFRLQPYRH
jgi:hypothetical protein